MNGRIRSAEGRAIRLPTKERKRIAAAFISKARESLWPIKGESVNRILWNHRDDGRLKRGEIDEIVLHNVNLHIEQMSDNCWWIGIYSRDDPEVSWMGNFIAPRKMTFSEQENAGIVWDQDESHEVGA